MVGCVSSLPISTGESQDRLELLTIMVDHYPLFEFACKNVHHSLMQLNVVNAKYEPRVSRVLSMRVVDHVVVSVACVRKEGKLIFLILFDPRLLLSLYTGTMAKEGDETFLLMRYPGLTSPVRNSGDMLRAAVREAIARPPPLPAHTVTA